MKRIFCLALILIACQTSSHVEAGIFDGPLFEDILRGDTAKIDRRLRNGKDPNKIPYFHRDNNRIFYYPGTYLHYAVKNNGINVEIIVDLLLQAGADVNAQVRPVPIPLRSRYFPSVKSEIGYTALSYAVNNNNLSLAEKLLENRADPNICDANNKSPLLIAFERNSTEMVSLLLKHRADPNICDINRGSPLSIAVERNSTEMVSLLLKHRADPNLGIYQAIKNKNHEMLTQLIENHAKLCIPIIDGLTPLMIAVQANDLTLVELLLNSECGINVQNTNGDTALHLAAALDSSKENSMKIIELLLKKGADPTIRNNDGRNPVGIAFKEGRDLTYKKLETFIEEYTPQSSSLQPGDAIAQ